MFNRRFLFVGVALVLVIFLGLVRYRSRGSLQDDPVWTRIQSAGEVRFCLDPSFPPFESVDAKTGQLSGFDIDLAKELARRLELSASFVSIGFDGLYDALTANTCDLILSAFPYDPRQTEDFIFSVAYFNAGQVLVVPVSDARTRKMADLSGKAVAMEWGSDGDVTVRRWARRIPLTPSPSETSNEALQKVEKGVAQAAVVDAISAYIFIRNHRSLSVSATLTEDNYVIVMRSDAHTLQGHVNAILQDMRAEGFLKMLQERWF